MNSRIFYTGFVKPLLDRVCALILFVLVSPVILIVSGVVWISMGRPILFSQPRIGFKNKPFNILKFRTMTQKTGENGILLPDAERLTRVGTLIRKCSIDELPQLINILRGEMSFIGPRPLLVEYLPLYSPEQIKRHNVKPGISGWAQVNGRNQTTWQQRFEYDLEYVRGVSFGMDLEIFFKTILNVALRKGINQQLNETMPKFSGNHMS